MKRTRQKESNSMTRDEILLAIRTERERQQTMYPHQTLPRSCHSQEQHHALAEWQRRTNNKDGASWYTLFLEELHEAMAAPAESRAEELIQLAALCVQMVEATKWNGVAS